LSFASGSSGAWRLDREDAKTTRELVRRRRSQLQRVATTSSQEFNQFKVMVHILSDDG